MFLWNANKHKWCTAWRPRRPSSLISPQWKSQNFQRLSPWNLRSHDMLLGKDDVHQLHCCIHSQTWNAYLPFSRYLYWSIICPTEQWLHLHSNTVTSHYLLKNVMFKHGKRVSCRESSAVQIWLLHVLFTSLYKRSIQESIFIQTYCTVFVCM